MPPPRPIDEHDVARHARFLRGLAGSLVADPASADDAVQEAWLAALRRRPDATRPLEPWLARVVRNTLGKLRRGGARRARRERHAARDEARRGEHDAAERGRLLRRLLDEVLALAEPEREAVLLRYYEALPPRTIAARLGVPVEVVYRRLEHAIERLRARFEAPDPAGRRVSCLGLVGALGLPREVLGPAHAATLASTATTAAGAPASTATSFSGALAMAATTSSLVLAAVSLGAGVGLGWLASSQLRHPEPSPAESVPAPAAPRGVAVSAASAPSGAPAQHSLEPRPRIAQLEAQLRALREQHAALETELRALQEARDRAAEPVDAKALRFGLADPTPVFDRADWSALAGHLTEMNAAMPRLREALSAGKGIDPEVAHRMEEHERALALFGLAATPELKGTGRPGTWAFTHPAVVANLIRAALIAANEPLTAAQEQAILALGNAWVTDAERSVEAVAADAPALARTIAEVDAKERFLEALKVQLTPSQRAVLFRPETEGRLGLDLFSPALVYQVHVSVQGATAEQLAQALVAHLLLAAGAKDVDPASVIEVGRRWLDDLSPANAPRPAGDPEDRYPTLPTLQARARAQVGAIERLLEAATLTPEQADRLRRVTTVVTPELAPPK